MGQNKEGIFHSRGVRPKNPVSISSYDRGSISIHLFRVFGSSEYEYDKMSAVTYQHTFSQFGHVLGVHTVKPPCLGLAEVYLAEILGGAGVLH